MHITIRNIFIFVLFTSTSAAFANLTAKTLGDTVPGYVEYTKPIIIKRNNKTEYITGQKIQLQRVQLSPESRAWLAKHIRDPQPASFTENPAFPSSASIGMNGVPVLNQGDHGSCVAFATGSTVDAILGHGEFVSKVCTLALTKYLHQQADHYPNGWDATSVSLILDLYTKYGINSITSQKTYGCGGLYKYPTNSSRTGKAMAPEQYMLHSEMLMKNIKWHEVRSPDHLAVAPDTLNLLEHIKQDINQGNRVVLSFILESSGRHNGAHGTYKTGHDSWIVNDTVAKNLVKANVAIGHVIVITGYDDNAVIKGPKCSYHRGLVIARNSWGANAGDKGTYYMSYDYLYKLTTDAYVLIPQ